MPSIPEQDQAAVHVPAASSPQDMVVHPFLHSAGLPHLFHHCRCCQWALCAWAAPGPILTPISHLSGCFLSICAIDSSSFVLPLNAGAPQGFDFVFSSLTHSYPFPQLSLPFCADAIQIPVFSPASLQSSRPKYSVHPRDIYLCWISYR